MKYKKIIIFSAIFIIFALACNYAYAFELTYPKLPGGIEIKPGSQFPDFIKYFFVLGIAVAGILAVISLAIAGVQMMITSNPSLKSEAGARVKGAVLGLILVFASYLIMQTINPSLKTINLTELKPGAGVFYIKGSDLRLAPDVDDDTGPELAEGYNQLVYRCKEGGGGGTGPRLWVWKFPQINLGNYENAVVEVGACDHPFSLAGVASFKYSYEKPGVYYFSKTGCTGYASEVMNVSGPIDEKLKGKAMSMRILNDPDAKTYFGVIFHENPNYTKGGLCSVPIFTNSASECKDIASYGITVSADVFIFNNNYASAGDKITFNSEPFGEDTASKNKGKGYYILQSGDLQSLLSLNPAEMLFAFTDNATPQYRAAHPTFQLGPGSIEINGDYLVGLYSNTHCQTFRQSVSNLGGENITPTGALLTGVLIIATK
jgi:hypothetical protein